MHFGIYQALERIGQQAGIEDVRLSPHAFRHTFAVSWLANDGDVSKLSRVLGHTDKKDPGAYESCHPFRRVTKADYNVPDICEVITIPPTTVCTSVSL